MWQDRPLCGICNQRTIVIIITITTALCRICVEIGCIEDAKKLNTIYLKSIYIIINIIPIGYRNNINYNIIINIIIIIIPIGYRKPTPGMFSTCV